MSDLKYQVGKTYVLSGAEVKIEHYSRRDGRYKVEWLGVESRKGKGPDPSSYEMVPAARLHLLLKGAKEKKG